MSWHQTNQGTAAEKPKDTGGGCPEIKLRTVKKDGMEAVSVNFERGRQGRKEREHLLVGSQNGR